MTSIIAFGFGLVIGIILMILFLSKPSNDFEIEVEMLSRELIDARAELKRRGRSLDKFREYNKINDGDWWKTGGPNPFGDCS